MKIEAETATISPGLVKWPMLKWFFVKGCISHEAVIKMPHVGKNVFSKLTLSLCNLHKKLCFQGLASCISRRENSSHTGTSVASCYTTSSSTGCFKDYRFSIHQCTRVSGRSHKWYTTRIKADNIYVHAYRSKSIRYWDMTGLGNFHSRVCVVTTVNIGERSKRWVNEFALAIFVNQQTSSENVLQLSSSFDALHISRFSEEGLLQQSHESAQSTWKQKRVQQSEWWRWRRRRKGNFKFYLWSKESKISFINLNDFRAQKSDFFQGTRNASMKLNFYTTSAVF